MFFATVPTIKATYSEEAYNTIPPRKECTESVDMVLNIPIAVNFFFDFIV